MLQDRSESVKDLTTKLGPLNLAGGTDVSSSSRLSARRQAAAMRTFGRLTPKWTFSMASTSSSSRSTLANFVGLQGIATLNIIRNFLLVPIYLRHFGADLYGAWVAVLGMAALVQLADLGVPRMLIQRTAALHGVSDHLGLGRTAASGLVSLALVTLALLGLLFPLAGWMTSVFGLTGPRAVLITEASRLVLLDGVLMLFVYGEAGVLLGLQKPSQAMLSLILGQLVGIVATLVLLGQGISLPALPLGMLTGTGFALLLTTVA